MEIGGHSPRCINCGSTYSKIVDKRARDTDTRGDIYRRRECAKCGTRFSTWEVSKDSYETITNGRKWFNNAKALLYRFKKHGINRFDKIENLTRTREAAELWNDPNFALGVEYGARLALIQLFDFNENE